MRLRVANRHQGRLTVQASAEDEDYFTLGSRFDVELIDGSLIVSKCTTGRLTCHVPAAYGRGGFTRAIVSQFPPDWLPSFCVDEAEFVEDDDLLVWEVPPFHELPWTSRGSRDVCCVKRNLVLRVRSAVAAGVPVTLVTKHVPQWARGVLPREEWMQIVTAYV